MEENRCAAIERTLREIFIVSPSPICRFYGFPRKSHAKERLRRFASSALYCCRVQKRRATKLHKIRCDVIAARRGEEMSRGLKLFRVANENVCHWEIIHSSFRRAAGPCRLLSLLDAIGSEQTAIQSIAECARYSAPI